MQKLPYAYDLTRFEECLEAGYFEPRDTVPFISGDEYEGQFLYRGMWGSRPITTDTLILYYPGSFGVFHEGHVATVLSAWREAIRIAKDVRVIISPANADYVCEKYGQWSERASNKMRVEKICKALPKVGIDLAPMMNYRCDQNFPDLLLEFINREVGVDISEMKWKPWIICGKDRQNFKKLENFTDDFKIYFADDTTGASTSAQENKFIPKKNLVLRVRNTNEFKVFSEFFGDQYLSIEPSYLHNELHLATEYARMNGIKYTNCRTYRDILEYVPVSRMWTNPLMQSENFSVGSKFHELPPNSHVLDSDIFSGSTERFFKKNGHTLHAIINVRGRENIEIVDVWDLMKEGKYKYPYVDISSRCSMQAFDYKMHERLENFRNAF